MVELRSRLTAEALGTALLLAIVIGSGIMAERLAGGNAAIALLANTAATVGGLYVLKPFGGMPASTYRHDVELHVRPVGSHPVVKGLPPMRLWDETYKNVWRDPRTQVLLETEHPTSDREIGWISPYAKSRVIYVQLGHGREAHEHPWYRRLVHNAILWSGGRLN